MLYAYNLSSQTQQNVSASGAAKEPTLVTDMYTSSVHIACYIQFNLTFSELK